MKLFISNRDFFSKDCGNSERDVHKEAFKELQNSLIYKKSIPVFLMPRFKEIDYVFKLMSCDIESDVFVYEFSYSVYS